VVAGIFFAFSNFVMRALGRVQLSAGMAAMQAINITVVNPMFFLFFLGAAFLSLVLCVFALLRWQHPSAAWLLAGGVLYVVGSFVVTVAGNVPLNAALAQRDPSTPASGSFWAEYISRWLAWNHVRTVASLLAAAAFSMGLPR